MSPMAALDKLWLPLKWHKTKDAVVDTKHRRSPLVALLSLTQLKRASSSEGKFWRMLWRSKTCPTLSPASGLPNPCIFLYEKCLPLTLVTFLYFVQDPTYNIFSIWSYKKNATVPWGFSWVYTTHVHKFKEEVKRPYVNRTSRNGGTVYIRSKRPSGRFGFSLLGFLFLTYSRA